MRQIKWLIPFVFLFISLLLLSACGESLQKPTGLEDDQEEQLENVTDEAVDKEDERIRSKEEKAEERLSKADKEESDQESKDKKVDSDDQQAHSNKNESAEKSDQELSSKEKTSSESTSDNKGKQTNETKSKKDHPKKDTSKKDTKETNNEKQKEPKKKTDESPPKKDANKAEAPPKKEGPKETKKTIVFSIKVPNEKVLLAETTVELKDGDTVLKVLDRMTREKGIQRTIQSSGYVSSIGNFEEKSGGSGSGWMYSVNGTFPNIGSAGYTLNDGDVVEWLFTKDLGEDIGAP